MLAHQQAKVYREAAARSASPGQLVLMLFDGALRFMQSSLDGFLETDLIRRHEAVHNNLQKTQAVLTELQATLNLEVGGEFGMTMYRLYDFMKDELRKANQTKDRSSIEVVIELLSPIRDAWSQMLQQSAPPRPQGQLAVAC